MELSFNSSNFHYAFGTHDRVSIEGMSYRPTSHNETGYVMTMTDGAGLSKAFTHEQLSRLGSMGRIHQEPNYFRPEEAARRLSSTTGLISELPKKQTARLSRRSAFVDAFFDLEKQGKIKRTDESINAGKKDLLFGAIQMAKNLNPLNENKASPSVDFAEVPSARTLRRWIKQAEEFGTGGLVDGMHRRGNRNRVMGPEEQGLMMKEVRGYLSLEKPTIVAIYVNVEISFTRRNEDRVARGLPPFNIPSKETVRRAIRSLDPFTVMVARDGLEAARKKFRPVGQGFDLTRALQRVEMDEATIDVMSVLHSTGLINYLTEEERTSMGLDGSKARWLMSVAVCCTTRCIVGMVLTRTATATAAVQTLQMVVSDKGQWADMVGALGSWDMHGTPETIVTDCGTAYQSEEFRFACSDLGITAQRAVAGFPEMRSWIERLFGTITQNLMPRLAGRTFSDIITKGDADPRERAALTVDDLMFALVRWTVDIYHNMPHQGLGGETPLSCWRRLTKEWGVQSPPDLRRQRLVFGSRLTPKLDKKGVTVLNVRYHSERLATWMNRKDECAIDVRWHPRDIGAIEACLDGEWFEIPAVEAGLEGVSAQAWLAASRELRATDPARKSFDRKVIHEAIEAITERNAAAIATAGLLVPDWSPERIQREENRNLISFKVSTNKKTAKSDGSVGQSIPDPEDYNSDVEVRKERPVKKSRNHKPGSKDWTIKGKDE